MNIFLSIITPIISCIMNYACMTYFFGAMSSGKKRSILSSVGIVSFFVFLFTMFFVKQPLVRLLLLTFATALYTYLFAYKFYNRIFITIAYIALSSLGENIITYLCLLFFDINFYIDNSGPNFLLATISAKLLGFAIIYIVVISKRQLMNGSFRFSLLLLPFSTVFVSVSLYYMLEGVYTAPTLKTNMMCLTSMVLLIVSNLFIFRIVDKMKRDTEYESRLDYANELVKKQAEQYDTLFRNGQEVYKIQHDNKNFLLGIVSELQSGNTDSATLMLKERIAGFSSSEKDTITGNSIVDTVLNHKFAEAKENGIKVEFEHKNAGAIKIPGIDFAVLIGNALDNALEASKALPEDKKLIRIIIVVINDRINICISNYVKEDISTYNLKTGKINPDRHGFGIINMRSIAAKYNGEVVFECKDRTFKTIIMIDNKEASEL